MTFVEMRDALIKHFEEMTADGAQLFVVNVDKDEMWETYLNSFTDEQNPIFRVRREYDCSCCRHFIKQIGNVVTIRDGVIGTIWDILELDSDPDYGTMLDNMAEYVRQRAITSGIDNVFLSKEAKIGTPRNYWDILGLDGVLRSYRFDHFYLELPERYVIKDANARNAKLNEYKTGMEVFERALREIDMDALDTVIGLCESNTLYQGETYYKMVEAFRDYKVKYLEALEHGISSKRFAWENSVKAGFDVCRIRNRAIGTLLVDLSEGMDIEEAVRRYEVVTAPTNYRRPKPIFTKKMLEDAKKTITELGYLDSLPRRFAKLDDISVNDVLFADRDAAERMKDSENVFDILSSMTTSKSDGKAQNFDNVPNVTPDTFLNDILPTARNIEVYVGNEHANNFVSLIAPKNANAKSMFKWGNGFSWAYAGNLTDSDMKQRVKAAGGKVDGDLRFSIQWNEDGRDNCDLDAHCMESNGEEIYFRTYRAPSFSKNGGQLDVDIINPNCNIAVENITFADRKKMKPGWYVFYVHQYNGSARNGFRAEIEYDGEIFKYDYNKSMKPNDIIIVARVYLDRNGAFTTEHHIPSDRTSRTIWNVPTNQFIPVSVVCHSPNHWSTCDKPTGHNHLMFMLKGCVSDETPNGMFNEYLVSDLYDHRRVMEALSGQMRVENSDDQLSGLGFALDRRAELVVKVTTDHDTKVYRIKF